MQNIDWYETSEKTPDLFRRPQVSPQGQDGTAHFNFYDNERSLSFQWDGHTGQHVVVSYGGYGEPIKWSFDFREFWEKGVLKGYIKHPGPVFTQGDEMFSAAYHFQRACENWIKDMEERYDDLMDEQEAAESTSVDKYPHVYNRVFDAVNKNWIKEPMANYLFLKGVQQHMNNVLETRGHVFLNEVFDALAMTRTPAGAILGWYKEEGSKSIDFVLPEPGDDAIWLTFSTDGVIYDKL
jgi:hypothetical protein